MIRKYLIPILAAAGIGFGIATVIKGNKVNPPALPVAEPAKTPYQTFVAGSGIVEASAGNSPSARRSPGWWRKSTSRWAAT